MSQNKGYYNRSQEHSLNARGIKTLNDYNSTKNELKIINKKQSEYKNQINIIRKNLLNDVANKITMAMKDVNKNSPFFDVSDGAHWVGDKEYYNKSMIISYMLTINEKNETEAVVNTNSKNYVEINDIESKKEFVDFSEMLKEKIGSKTVIKHVTEYVCPNPKQSRYSINIAINMEEALKNMKD